MRRLIVPLLVMMAVASACGGTRLEDEAGGLEIYQATCARCHSADLSGGIGPALGAGSASSDKPREYFIQTTARGQGRMPSYGGTLSTEQIDRVVDFMLVEQGRGPVE